YAALMISMLHASSALAQREECLHTKEGVPMKAIIKQDAAVYEEPSESSGSKPVRTFDWFYVLPVEKGSQEKLKNGFYRVAQGTGFDQHVGWVKEEVIVEWNHRQAISFRGNPHRERVLFYNSFEDLQKYILETKNSRNPQPISQEPENLGSDFFVMPVLDVRILNVNGTDTDIYRAAYLHGNGSGRPSNGSFPNREKEGSKTISEFQEEFTLDVVFVIDTTRSMQPWIDGVKEVVRKVSDSLVREDPKIKGRVRFGLVAYRDKMRTSEADRQIEYLTKIFCKLSEGKEPQVFLQNVSNLKRADVGSEDWPEDVFAGMKVAIQQMDWNPIADRHLILIGDASAQDNIKKSNGPGSSSSAYKNFYNSTTGAILSMAQPPGRGIIPAQRSITIHALRIKGEYPADWPKCEVQFKKLAAGLDLPGVYKAYNLGEMNGFVDDLLGHDHIKSAIERLKFVQSAPTADVVFRAAAAKDGLLNVPSLRNLITSTLKGEEIEHGQVTDFTSGWACKVDIHDNFQLEPHVLVTRGRMETFVTVLDNILHILDKTREPGSGDIAKALQSLQIVATHVMYEEQIDKETKLGDILSWILALPIKSKIFNMSIPALRAMTQEHFDDWVNSVHETRQIIQDSLDDRPRWRSIGSSTSEIEKRAFIKLADMP
ncbi:MAG: vWA domain-containing protein, partial [Desulfatiglandales bacterium]